jgi:hypothetical protein
MEGLSERAYAERSGLSRGAVQKARKNGRLVLFADGSINAAASDARRGMMTDPDQQMRSRAGSGAGGDGASVGSGGISGPGDSTSYLKARTALTVYQAQERQLSIQKKKGVLVDRARAETLVFRLARQERDTWVTWPTRVAALMAAQLSAEMEKASSTPVIIETAILQRVLETHVREQLNALADLRVSLA